MSELINNSEMRVEQLLAFSLGIMNGENGKMLIEKYRQAIDAITPFDMLQLEDKQLEMGITPQEIKKDIDKVINVFFKSLEKYAWEKPRSGFLYYLMLENEAFRFKLNQIKKIFKSYKGRESTDFDDMRREILPRFREFNHFEAHYLKKELILFPHLEKTWKNQRPLVVMWSLHDDIRRKLKQVLALLENPHTSWEEFNRSMGKYYYLVFGMIQKENLVLYPIAAKTVEADAWQRQHLQSFEYGFPFIEAPEKPQDTSTEALIKQTSAAETVSGIVSETGNMSVEQTLLLLNHLPVDITYVDENDRVVFFNKAKDRVFPRSPAIVGRAVQKCHPPESVHMVEQIVEAFRKGERHQADFWINMKGRFLLIQYFAVRDADGIYKGVIEVSQDATQIRSLTGERRLLQWE